MPLVVEDVVTMLLDGGAQGFHVNYFFKGHGPTDFQRWAAAATEEGAGGKKKAARTYLHRRWCIQGATGGRCFACRTSQVPLACFHRALGVLERRRTGSFLV